MNVLPLPYRPAGSDNEGSHSCKISATVHAAIALGLAQQGSIICEKIRF
jgi:hypothetical protein